MNCKEVLGKMSEFLDAELMDTVCDQLREHLEKCEHCRIEVNTVRRTIEIFQQMECKSVPGHVHEKLFKTLRFDTIGDPEENK